MRPQRAGIAASRGFEPESVVTSTTRVVEPNQSAKVAPRSSPRSALATRVRSRPRLTARRGVDRALVLRPERCEHSRVGKVVPEHLNLVRVNGEAAGDALYRAHAVRLDERHEHEHVLVGHRFDRDFRARLSPGGMCFFEGA